MPYKNAINNNDKLELGTISFQFCLSRKEAKAVIKKPTSKLARDLRKYFQNILTEGCKKFLESKPEETIKDCKLNLEEGLKNN